MSEQLELFPEDPAQDKAADKEKVAKARARAAENEEFKDKRVKSSPLIQQAEVAKMREILAKPRAEKPEQARMKYGNPELEKATEGWERKGEKWSPKVSGGASGGAGGIELEGKMGKNTKPKMKAGGSVRSSASKRADGCAQRGKTKGRMV